MNISCKWCLHSSCLVIVMYVHFAILSCVNFLIILAISGPVIIHLQRALGLSVRLTAPLPLFLFMSLIKVHSWKYSLDLLNCEVASNKLPVNIWVYLGKWRHISSCPSRFVLLFNSRSFSVLSTEVVCRGKEGECKTSSFSTSVME